MEVTIYRDIPLKYSIRYDDKWYNGYLYREEVNPCRDEVFFLSNDYLQGSTPKKMEYLKRELAIERSYWLAATDSNASTVNLLSGTGIMETKLGWNKEDTPTKSISIFDLGLKDGDYITGTIGLGPNNYSTEGYLVPGATKTMMHFMHKDINSYNSGIGSNLHNYKKNLNVNKTWVLTKDRLDWKDNFVPTPAATIQNISTFKSNKILDLNLPPNNTVLVQLEMTSRPGTLKGYLFREDNKYYILHSDNFYQGSQPRDFVRLKEILTIQYSYIIGGVGYAAFERYCNPDSLQVLGGISRLESYSKSLLDGEILKIYPDIDTIETRLKLQERFTSLDILPNKSSLIDTLESFDIKQDLKHQTPVILSSGKKKNSLIIINI